MTSSNSSHHVLVIDDNPSIHEDMRRILQTGGIDRLAAAEADLFGAPASKGLADPTPAMCFEIASALQGQQGLALVEEALRRGERFRLAFVDMRMPPGWNGIETIRNLWRVDPDLEVAICTAYSDYSWQEILGQLGRSDRLLILKKPFEGIEVRQIAMSLAAKSALREAQANRVADLEQAVAARSEDLIAAKLAAEAGSRAKSDFLANMSHEIRTPLNGIVGMLELLEATALDETQVRYVRGAQLSVDCLLSLMNDVLDFSKIEAGKIELDSVEFNPRTLFEDVTEMIAPKAQAKGIEVCCDLDGGLPTKLVGDADRLRQILLNLASNAVKFTARGQVTMRAWREACTDGVMLRCEVSDSGIGIPEDRRQRLFQVFSQVDSSTTRRYGGTGLGLALCKRLVELFGGEIGVESRENLGSTFWFTARFQVAAQPTPAERAPAELGKLRVLAVDDNFTNLEITSGQLHRWGIVCDVVSDASAALEELLGAQERGKPYGLAILDMQMPEMDGGELIDKIRATRELADLPVIVTTSMGQSPSQDELARWKLSSYLKKPIRQSRLFDSIVAAVAGDRRLETATSLTNAAGETLAFDPAAGIRLLVAEDNEINQVVVTDTLRRMGLSCQLANNGREAVDLAATRAFDLVLMDCQMPVLDGFAAAGEIRAREAAEGGWRRAGGRLPIFALTANAVAGDREECFAAGMDEHLTKPIDRRKLALALRKYFIGSAIGGLAEAAGDRGQTVSTAEQQVVEPAKPCFNREQLLNISSHDASMAAELLRMFEDRAIGTLQAVEACAARSDRPELLRLVHSFKGVAGNLAAQSLFELTAKIEREHRHGAGDEACLLRDVAAMCAEVRRCLADSPRLRATLAEGVGQ